MIPREIKLALNAQKGPHYAFNMGGLEPQLFFLFWGGGWGEILTSWWQISSFLLGNKSRQVFLSLPYFQLIKCVQSVWILKIRHHWTAPNFSFQCWARGTCSACRSPGSCWGLEKAFDRAGWDPHRIREPSPPGRFTGTRDGPGLLGSSSSMNWDFGEQFLRLPPPSWEALWSSPS